MELDEEAGYITDEELVMSKQQTSDPAEDNRIVKESSVTIDGTIKEDDIFTSTLPCQLPPNELSPGSFLLPCTTGSLNLYTMADLGACVNMMPNSIFKHLELDNLRETTMSVEMGRPFLETIQAQIDVFKEEVSLGIGKDRALDPWHDEGFEEYELWRSEDEKTDYEPPFVNVKTYEIKKYSFRGGRNFICITKKEDDALPLGRVNGAREEFCLVTGLKFGVENWVDYNDEDEPIPFRRQGHVHAERLTPDEIEAPSIWWVFSRAYFDGRVSVAERIPRHLNRFMKGMTVGLVRQAQPDPIIIAQHFGLRDLSGFQSLQVGSSTF
uniref:Uncharacterized protein n=1 Tax=Tanacetum cinerariifolium TaxID=118510 RepID=A0A699GTC9_TANCI|nr:hypothetical protein [Tanacetum cinerariifolium]